MPKFLEEKLEKEYKNMPKERREHAVYGTMNEIGAMKGNKETKKGKEMEKKHEKKEHKKNCDCKECSHKKEIAKKMK